MATYKSAEIKFSDEISLECYSKAKGEYFYSQKGAAVCVSRNQSSMQNYLKAKDIEPLKVKAQTKGGLKTISAIPSGVVSSYWMTQALNNNGKASILCETLMNETLDTRASQVLGHNIPSTADIEIQIETGKKLARWEAERDFNAEIQAYYQDTTGNRAGHIHNAIYQALFGKRARVMLETMTQVESEKWKNPHVALNRVEEPEDVRIVVRVKQEIMHLIPKLQTKLTEKELVKLAIENLTGKGKI
jgi:hypothetical protein